MQGSLGVRKGAWTEEEDVLLKQCIEIYGEGKWHQVPLRAGLNRCRKSCRLRWLNYLKPNIKRGEFTGDEVDLMIRLHNLLGNRWSLIAGRLPGRTANDVKNYWNTHLRKKCVFAREKLEVKAQPETSTTNIIIKPQPRTFSKKLSWLNRKTTTNYEINNQALDNPCEPSLSIFTPLINNDIKWWESVFAGIENEGNTFFSVSGSESDQPLACPSGTKSEPPPIINGGSLGEQIQQGICCNSDMQFDIDLGDIFYD